MLSGHQLFLDMLNLRSKIFRNFFIYRVVWTLNFSEGGLGQLFLVIPNLIPKNFLDFFCLQSILDSEFFARGVGSGHQIFLVN